MLKIFTAFYGLNFVFNFLIIQGIKSHHQKIGSNLDYSLGYEVLFSAVAPNLFILIPCGLFILIHLISRSTDNPSEPL